MKKDYVKPELEMIMFSPESLMMGGSIIEGGDNPVEPLTNKKEQDRNWGRDLWGEKE